MNMNAKHKQSKNFLQCSYSFHFEPIDNSFTTVQIRDQTKEVKTVGISIDDYHFSFRNCKFIPDFISDLIDLAVAIYSSDRLSIQNPSKKITDISVILPLRNPERFRRIDFEQKLSELLYWMTGNNWKFEYKRRTTIRSVELQSSLVYDELEKNQEILLWSGGLDALAGLYDQIQKNKEQRFILFGSGSNDYIHHRQQRVFKLLSSDYQKHLSLYQVPIRFSRSGAVPKNKRSRARGILFLFLGAACSYLLGKRTLSVYENGVGAINLPYTRASIGLDHSRSVHPITLMKVSDILSDVIEEPFRIHNPYLFVTKAHMCQALVQDNRTFLISETISCDSRHRKKQVQCGYCSSCLLRRQALLAAGIEDQTEYVITHGDCLCKDPGLYLRHMLAQVDDLDMILKSSDDHSPRWRSLSRQYTVLDDIVDRCMESEGLSFDTMRQNLLGLYYRYVNEWRAVKDKVVCAPQGEVNTFLEVSQDQLLSTI